VVEFHGLLNAWKRFGIYLTPHRCIARRIQGIVPIKCRQVALVCHTGFIPEIAMVDPVYLKAMDAQVEQVGIA
jgi:hypothetical protein